MLCLVQLKSENAKLKQKISNFPSYSKVPKPFDPPDKEDFNAAKTAVYEVKLEAIKTVSKDNKEYLASYECCTLVDSLLQIMTKTFLNFIARSKDYLHGSLIDWFNASITKANHMRTVDCLLSFKHQVMAGLIPSTCFPVIDLRRDFFHHVKSAHGTHDQMVGCSKK